MRRAALALLSLTALAGPGAASTAPTALAAGPEPLGIAMEGHPYPFPVHLLPLTVEGQDVRLAYMDVRPASPNGRAVLLLHGKNFYGAYWEATIRALSRSGFRVVVPDQLGFGKSSKPDLHYGFELLASTTKQLLDALQIEKVAVVGHSMGGMLAVRFALMFQGVTSELVLENPIGLEDYREKVPYQTVEQQYRAALGQSEESLRKLIAGYFVTWKPAYEPLVLVPYRWTLSAEYPRYALASALTYQMIYAQPVVQDLPRLRVPTLLVIGQADRTFVGRGSVAPEVAATLGRFPELGRRAAAAIPGAKLVEIPACGHIPHLEAQARFEEALLAFLRR